MTTEQAPLQALDAEAKRRFPAGRISNAIAEKHFRAGGEFMAQHDAAARKPPADLAFEGALLIEWVRQVVGGLSDPSREDLNDLFDKCEDYSNKWNSGNTEALPDPRGPSWEQVRDALVEHDDWDFGKPGQTLPRCACGHKLITTRGNSMRADHLDHRVQAVRAIMPKPTDTEETNR